MSIVNITTVQKRIIIAGLLVLHTPHQLEDYDIETVHEQKVKDFLLVAKYLRFYSLDADFDRYYFISKFDFDCGFSFDLGFRCIIKESDEFVNELFDKCNCIEYIKFMDFLNILYQNTLLANKIDESRLQQIGYIALKKELFLTALKDNKINDDYLLLFRELAYLGLKKEHKKTELLRIEKSRAVRNKNTVVRSTRESAIVDFLMKKDIIELSQFINQGKKRCINFIVELDYNFCKENDLGVYRGSLEHLKVSNKNNLSRCATGRKWLNFLRFFILNTMEFEFKLGLLDSTEETRNAYNLIHESWLKNSLSE